MKNAPARSGQPYGSAPLFLSCIRYHIVGRTIVARVGERNKSGQLMRVTDSCCQTFIYFEHQVFILSNSETYHMGSYAHTQHYFVLYCSFLVVIIVFDIVVDVILDIVVVVFSPPNNHQRNKHFGNRDEGK